MMDKMKEKVQSGMDKVKSTFGGHDDKTATESTTRYEGSDETMPTHTSKGTYQGQASPADTIKEKGRHAEDKGSEYYESSKDKASDAREKMKEKSEQAQDKGSQYYQSAKDKAADAREKMKEKGEQAQDKGSEYYQSAKEKATDARDTMKDKLHQAKETLKEKAADVQESESGDAAKETGKEYREDDRTQSTQVSKDKETAQRGSYA
ncbi:hypothetical protein B5M09_011292 [Aphanomyces astaci]|uniref:Uncharacterized protein n=1 Tax=Aphanomyces astaci TaxID=112090 RepID=A0A425CRM7_APHAT|nr:hypothetical protein B5M09_011292 [Aphanomyces astaci]